MVTCPGVAQAKTVARKVFESGGELLHYEGQKCVNLACNTTKTVLQVLAMDWTPECNRVEEKSLEEMIMIVSQCVYQRVDVKIKYEQKANMKSLVGDETDETLLKSLL